MAKLKKVNTVPDFLKNVVKENQTLYELKTSSSKVEKIKNFKCIGLNKDFHYYIYEIKSEEN